MAIKNYLPKRISLKKGSAEKIKVSDYMSSKLVTFKPDQSVMEVMHVLIKKKISGAPVVNDKNELVGIISEGDCIKQISQSRYYNQPLDDVKVKEHMVTQVETIPDDMNVFDAADKFLNARRRRFPIVKEGKLIGLISQKDILKAALKLKGHSW